MATLVFFMSVFLVISIVFLFIHLMMGKMIRPARPDADKLTIYECGEPTIGSAWVQFDLRFYVVALLFVIFDVEVAFFFRWAEVFGKSNAVAAIEKPTTAAEYREYATRVLDVAPPASSSSLQRSNVERYQAITARKEDGSPAFDDERLAQLLRDQEALREKDQRGKLTNRESIQLQFDGPLRLNEFQKNREAARMLS